MRNLETNVVCTCKGWKTVLLQARFPVILLVNTVAGRSPKPHCSLLCYSSRDLCFPTHKHFPSWEHAQRSTGRSEDKTPWLQVCNFSSFHLNQMHNQPLLLGAYNSLQVFHFLEGIRRNSPGTETMDTWMERPGWRHEEILPQPQCRGQDRQQETLSTWLI